MKSIQDKLQEMPALHTKPSTYLGLVVWGTAGFMGSPTFASFIVHFTILPLTIVAMLWMAHYEGRNEAK